MLEAIFLNSILYKLLTLNKQFIYLNQIYKNSTVHKNGLFISSVSTSNWGGKNACNTWNWIGF